jgi:hypothetical protein
VADTNTVDRTRPNAQGDLLFAAFVVAELHKAVPEMPPASGSKPHQRATGSNVKQLAGTLNSVWRNPCARRRVD